MPQTQAISMNLHYNCVYMETKRVSAFGCFGKRRVMIFAGRVQDALLLVKFPWLLLIDVVSQVYQKWLMSEANTALNFP